MMPYIVEYLFGQWGPNVLVASPLNSLCTSCLLTGGMRRGAQNVLTLWKHCSATTKTFLHHQFCCQHKFKIYSYTRYCEENYPNQNQRDNKIEKFISPWAMECRKSFKSTYLKWRKKNSKLPKPSRKYSHPLIIWDLPMKSL